uniref:Homeobox domain-containing protein n=1 Tax=Elaeophora elaphi TaxID=1147741 RepID=A0A0R3RIN3_9BILA
MLFISSSNLPGPQDLMMLAKMFTLPYAPYFLPKVSLFSAPKRTKLSGLPPLPNHPIEEILIIRYKYEKLKPEKAKLRLKEAKTCI